MYFYVDSHTSMTYISFIRGNQASQQTENIMTITIFTLPQITHKDHKIIQYDPQSFMVYHLSDPCQAVWEDHNIEKAKAWIDKQVEA